MINNTTILKKSLRKASMGIAIVALTAFGGGQVSAAAQMENSGAAQISILDLNRILAEAKVTDSIRKQMEKFQKEFQAEIKKREENLRKLNNQLVKEEKTLDKKAFETKKADFDKKVADLQGIVMTRNSALEGAYKKTMETVRMAVVDLSEEIRVARGDQLLVMPSSFPVTYKKSLDITDEVIDKLNKKFPTMKVVISKPQPVVKQQTAKTQAAKAA